jgi:hypothetical protein
MMCGALLMGLASCGGGGKSKNADSTDTSANKNNSTSNSNKNNEGEQSGESGNSSQGSSSEANQKAAEVIKEYCNKLNSFGFMKIKPLFADNVKQYIGMKNTTNEAIAKEVNRFLSTKRFIDYYAEIDQLKMNGKTASVPMNISWAGYQTRLLAEIEFDDNYKIVSYKEAKALPSGKTLKTAKRKVLKGYEGCDPQKDKDGCAYMLFDYVKVTQAPAAGLQDKMNQKIFSMLGSSTGATIASEADLTKTANDFVKSFAEFAKEGRAMGAWDTNTSLDVRENKGIASIVCSSEGYGGGAHGFSSINIVHYDVNTGNELTLDNVMVDNYLPELKKIATKVLRKQNEVPDDKTLNQYGYSMDDNEKLVLAKSFTFDGYHIEFLYGRYEAGPYAMPPPMLRISYDDIKHLIKKDGPLGHKVK